MDLAGLTTSCYNAVKRQKQLSYIASKLPAVLILCLCSCMLWQCTSCILKYFASPTGASVTFSRDLSQSPVCITICNKGENLNYTFPELRAVDVSQGQGSNWQTVWPTSHNLSVHSTADTFVTITHQTNLRLCMTINVHDSSPSEFRIRHYFSKLHNLNKMEVYLHNQGLFQSSDFSILMPKKIFTQDEDVILELSLETMISLPSADFNCSQAKAAQTLDSCLLTEAASAANQSIGCISKFIK